MAKDIRELLAHATGQKWYTVEAAAEETGRAAVTIRKYCRGNSFGYRVLPNALQIDTNDGRSPWLIPQSDLDKMEARQHPSGVHGPRGGEG